MAQIALFSDIHGNDEALQAVWRDIEQRGIDRVYCLGDLVGYGPRPNEVINFMREKNIPTVMGNYDDGVAFDRFLCGCDYPSEAEQLLGTKSLVWTREAVTRENKLFLQGLPPEISTRAAGVGILLFHGSPQVLNQYLPADTPVEILQEVSRGRAENLFCFGHTHLPYCRWVGEKLFVNTGSVGRPKDGDFRTCYALLTLEKGQKPQVEFVRLPYDVAKTAAQIKELGLPPEFATFLQRGGK